MHAPIVVHLITCLSLCFSMYLLVVWLLLATLVSIFRFLFIFFDLFFSFLSALICLDQNWIDVFLLLSQRLSSMLLDLGLKLIENKSTVALSSQNVLVFILFFGIFSVHWLVCSSKDYPRRCNWLHFSTGRPILGIGLGSNITCSHLNTCVFGKHFSWF